jgi:hypothetical protein
VRKIKEVLRLKFEVGLGLRQIARSCSIGLGTAHEYLQRAEAAKITWPLGPEWDDDRLEAALFGGPPRSRPTVLPVPGFAGLHRERQQHPHLTQQLLWEEYTRHRTRANLAIRHRHVHRTELPVRKTPDRRVQPLSASASRQHGSVRRHRCETLCHVWQKRRF